MGIVVSIVSFAILIYLFFKVRTIEEMLQEQRSENDQMKHLLKEIQDRSNHP